MALSPSPTPQNDTIWFLIGYQQVIKCVDIFSMRAIGKESRSCNEVSSQAHTNRDLHEFHVPIRRATRIFFISRNHMLIYLSRHKHLHWEQKERDAGPLQSVWNSFITISLIFLFPHIFTPFPESLQIHHTIKKVTRQRVFCCTLNKETMRQVFCYELWLLEAKWVTNQNFDKYQELELNAKKSSCIYDI